MADGMTGAWPEGLGNIADPAYSAWRVMLAGAGGSALVYGTITAEAKGTVTADVKGTLTAQLKGNGTAVNGWNSGWLASGLGNTGTGQAFDARSLKGDGYLFSWASGCSASATLLASHDSAKWMPVTSWGLADNGTATALVAGYYPWLCARVDNAYDNGWGASAITAVVSVHITKPA